MRKKKKEFQDYVRKFSKWIYPPILLSVTRINSVWIPFDQPNPYTKTPTSFSRNISTCIKEYMYDICLKHCDINGFQPCSGNQWCIVSKSEVQEHLLAGAVNFKTSMSFSGSLCRWLPWFSKEPDEISQIQNKCSRYFPEASKTAAREFLHRLPMRDEIR